MCNCPGAREGSRRSYRHRKDVLWSFHTGIQKSGGNNLGSFPGVFFHGKFQQCSAGNQTQKLGLLRALCTCLPSFLPSSLSLSISSLLFLLSFLLSSPSFLPFPFFLSLPSLLFFPNSGLGSNALLTAFLFSPGYRDSLREGTGLLKLCSTWRVHVRSKYFALSTAIEGDP